MAKGQHAGEDHRDAGGAGQFKLAGLRNLDIPAEQIEPLIAERLQARKDKDFARSDEIRDELDARGIMLLDSREGTSWKLK